MITKHRLIKALSSIALVACLAHAGPNADAQTYSLTDLGILAEQKGGISTPAAINTKGIVAGTSGNSAFRYDESKKEKMENVGSVPADSISRGFGINDSGQVVGDSTLGGSNPSTVLPPPSFEPISHAAIFDQGSAADLGTLKDVGNYSRANGVNASGQVVGFSGPTFDSNESRAFIWSASAGMLDLGTLGGAYAQAFAINDAGFVTGNSQTADGPLGAVHAFIYRPVSATEGLTAPMKDLGTLGGKSSYGTFISTDNYVVGYSEINSSGNRVHAFISDGTKMRDLGSLGGKDVRTDQSFALGVNASYQVVGYSYLPAGQVELAPRRAGVVPGPVIAPKPVAFIYSQGTMVDLNKLIGNAAENYRLYSATAINDKGQIVASAFDSSSNAFRAVLLTPQPSNHGLPISANPVPTSETEAKEMNGRNQTSTDRGKPTKR